LVSWSTDAIAERERFSFWQEVVCQNVLNVATAAPPRGFQARIRIESFGDLKVATFKSARHEMVRTRQHVARHPEDTYIISLPLGGLSRVAQNDSQVVLQDHDMAVVDGRLPFHASFTEEVGRIVAVIPHAVLDERAPWLRDGRPLRIAGNARFADLARRHLLELAGDALNETTAGMLTENLANLVALATAPEALPIGARPEAPIEAMLGFCRLHIHDAELSPQAVAAHFGISVRTLHLRFEAMGQSFGRWVLGSRLDACCRSLCDPCQRNASISDIAYRWGFNDLSHFNKRFRSRFGMSPREWRTAHESIS
jgi:AraC family transcriptional regulator, positive regulator of tynA and feaB